MEITELVKRLKEEEIKGNLKRNSEYAKWSEEHMSKAEFNLLSAGVEHLILTNADVRTLQNCFQSMISLTGL